MPTIALYTYCLRYDDGAAPNPYHGLCTLAICKPAIRRVAKPGDWVVGLGSSQSPIGDISGHVVYAMRINKRLSLRDYDGFCRDHLQGKIPKWASDNFVERVGDCIYDYSRPDDPVLRASVHTERNRQVDLSGRNALLSKHFFYFGNRPVQLPVHLQPIVHQTQGHKSNANAQYVAPFGEWIGSLGLEPRGLYGEPQLKSEILANADSCSRCSDRDLEEDQQDEMS